MLAQELAKVTTDVDTRIAQLARICAAELVSDGEIDAGVMLCVCHMVVSEQNYILRD